MRIDIKRNKSLFILLTMFFGLAVMSLAACTRTDPLPQYTVTFDSQGGSYVAPITVTEGSHIQEPAKPTKDGYIFSGWGYFYDGELYMWHWDTGIITRHRTLVAQWLSKTTPQALAAPKLSNLLIGQSLSDSRLTGKFSVEGELKLVGEIDRNAVYNEIGTYGGFDWVFTPADTETCNSVSGQVELSVYRKKITLEENGGFEIEDIFFNDSVTIEKKPLTAKNLYRFDGWAESNGSTNYITYPKVFTASDTLYAGYRFHSAGLYYGESFYDYYYDPDLKDFVYVKTMAAMPDWRSLGFDSKFSPIRSGTPLYYQPPAPVEGSIEGEVIIADMYNDQFVAAIGEFAGTRITGVVFNNYVRRLAEGAFYRCLNLTEVAIPSTVTEIEFEAFRYSSNLTRVEFEDGDGTVRFDSHIFRNCENLTDVTLRRITNISYGMFDHCSGLVNITIPEEVTSIAPLAFKDCDALKTVNMDIESDNIERVGDYAFAYCHELEEITFPPSASISPLAFNGAYKLTKLVITDDQINGIARELHEKFIGPAGDFQVNITRDAEYADMNFEGSYAANGEEIDLQFYDFSIYALNALIHEFFHHYQDVLLNGVGAETFDTVPNHVDTYWDSSQMYNNVPIWVVAHGDYEKHTSYYDWYSDEYVYVLIDEEILDSWREPYIEFTGGNYAEYWNQPFEKSARTFARWFTGIDYNLSTGVLE
jgi:hypothetical protein